jgi:hypothetical protein
MVIVLQCIHMHYATLKPYDDYDDYSDCSIAMHLHALYSAAILHEVTNE